MSFLIHSLQNNSNPSFYNAVKIKNAFHKLGLTYLYSGESNNIVYYFFQKSEVTERPFYKKGNSSLFVSGILFYKRLNYTDLIRDLKDKLILLINNEDLIREMGEKGRWHIEKFLIA